ncbi:MAG: serine hydrolase domain-containing protein [Arenicellales bacterium]
MQKRYLTVLLLFLLCSHGVLAPSVTMGSENRIQAVLNKSVSKNIDRKGGGLLSISLFDRKHNKICAASTFVSGKIAGANSSAVQSNTSYGIASITKTFVATLALIYSERKQLDLDAPVIGLVKEKKWLLDQISNKKFRRNFNSVTFRQLLSHRSGFADYWDNQLFFEAWEKGKNTYWRHLDTLKWAGKMNPQCKVDRCFEYSDTNYLIAGLLLERIFKKKLNVLFREEIFEPLEMQCSWMYFEESKPAQCGEVAHSYESKLDVTQNEMQSADWASGGLYSTLQDQSKFFSHLFLTDKLISEKSRKELLGFRKTGLAHNYKYGLGIYSISMGENMTLIGHEGIHNAFGFLWKERDIFFSGSLNQENNQVVDKLLYPVMRILKEDGVSPWFTLKDEGCDTFRTGDNNLKAAAMSVHVFDEMPASKELAPMEKPTTEVGDAWYAVNNGKEFIETAIALDGDVVTYETSDGCKYKELEWGFAPSLEWSDCPGSEDGTQNITKSTGSPWPMQVNTKFKYSFTGQGDGEWSGERKCEVKKQVRVKVPAGEYDTFKLECKDNWDTHTWWISPELGETIAFKNSDGLMELARP